MIPCFGSVPTLLAGFIQCTVPLDAGNHTVAAIASTPLLIFHATLVVSGDTIVTTFVTRTHRPTTPAASLCVIPTLTGLDLLNVRTTFGFGHVGRQSPRLADDSPKDKLQLYKWETLPTFPIPSKGSDRQHRRW